jgi:hypothetical protein
MMKYKALWLSVTIATGLCLATAQNSQVRSSSAAAKAEANSPQGATKPLTPKSAMPPARKSSAVVPHPSTSGPKTTAELSRLERQNIKTASPKKPAKSASLPKPAGTAGTSNTSGSGINFTYQKPVQQPAKKN